MHHLRRLKSTPHNPINSHSNNNFTLKSPQIRPLKPHLHQIHRSNQVIPIIGRIPGITGSRIRIRILLVHTSRIIQSGRIPIYIAMVVSSALVHLLAVMAAGACIGIVIDVLVISASCWVVGSAVCAAAAGVAVCAVAGAAVVTGAGGGAITAGGAIGAGAVGVGTVGVGGVAAAVGVASHFADCLVE